jgi:hypothetical protein
VAEIAGLEKYTPPDQRPAETLKVSERAKTLSWLRGGSDADNDSAAEKLNEIIQRAASGSSNEICGLPHAGKRTRHVR